MKTKTTMKTGFELLVSYRTPYGFKVCDQYFLGVNPKFAECVFDTLTGCDDIDDKTILRLDLMETSSGITSKVKSLGCKLSELYTNSITLRTHSFALV